MANKLTVINQLRAKIISQGVAGLRPDRGAIAGLNNHLLWTGDKVKNHANMTKTSAELVAQWNEEHPDDPVEE